MSCLLAARTIASRLSTNRRYGSATLAAAAVRNDPKREKFVIALGKSDEAYLKYSENRTSNVICLEHTFVPDAGKGKGLGKQLAEAAFQYAIEKQLKVKLECDFTVKYFKDNESKYKAYVTE
uniref:Protein NATD1 n=1 Tax=Anopheles merus TaxID=30066 RepID=A0A182VMB1_ANOME